MAKAKKNRVASSTTTRGSQNPPSNAGHDLIVESASRSPQRPASPKEVNSVVEAGKILRSVLSSAERANLESVLSSPSDR